MRYLLSYAHTLVFTVSREILPSRKWGQREIGLKAVFQEKNGSKGLDSLRHRQHHLVHAFQRESKGTGKEIAGSADQGK